MLRCVHAHRLGSMAQVLQQPGAWEGAHFRKAMLASRQQQPPHAAEPQVSDSSSDDDAICVLCNSGDDAGNMLLCDTCDLGHHLHCLKPKLDAIPLGDWFCAACIRKERALASNCDDRPVNLNLK